MPAASPPAPPSERFASFPSAVDPDTLASCFAGIQHSFEPQMVQYSNTNPLIDQADGEHGEAIQWKVSAYMDLDRTNEGAMQRSVQVNPQLKEACLPLLERCDALFVEWYERVHGEGAVKRLSRMQSFVTRYRARPQENALLRHIDGAMVDGSMILALPTSVPYTGGGVTVWDGQPEQAHHYEMGPGDALMLDNFVWHQGNPISAGERWALVIFYSVKETEGKRLGRVLHRCLKNQVQGELSPAELAAQQHKVRTKVLYTVPPFAHPKLLQAAQLTADDVLMSIGLGDGTLLLQAAEQVKSVVGVEVGEGSKEEVMGLVRGAGLQHKVVLRDVPLYSLKQELDLSGITVLILHMNTSYTNLLASMLRAVQHTIKVVSYGEPLRPVLEWTPAAKVLISCDNPSTVLEKYSRVPAYVYLLPLGRDHGLEEAQ